MATLSPTEESESFDGAGVEPAVDPHHSKVAPNDPRLRLGRTRGRVLRKGPALALALGLVGVILISLVVALEPSKASGGKAGSGETAPTSTAPTVPDAIRFASDRPPLVGPPLHSHRGQDAGLALDDGDPELTRDRRQGFRSSSPFSPERQRELDEEQAWKARGSGVLFETGAAGVTGPMLTPNAPAHAPPEPSKLGGPSNPTGSDDPNLQERKNAFVGDLGGSKTRNGSEARVQKPASPYEIQAGSIIPAVLLTAINSDLPGPVVGQVRENVYDSVTGNTLLIPQGSRLLANYDSMVVWGQERVLVCWNRLIFPNGDSINLDCMPAADLEGAAGLSDEVNEHWGRLIKGAAISSLLAATSQAAAGNTEGFNPTVPQVWARSAGGEVNQIGQRLTARNLNVQPTLTIRAGYSVNVMVTKDLVVPPYRVASTAAPARSSLSR